MALVGALLLWRRKMSKKTADRLRHINQSFTPMNKFKICLTFYQLATKVPTICRHHTTEPQTTRWTIAEPPVVRSRADQTTSCSRRT